MLTKSWIQPKPFDLTMYHNTLCEFCGGMVGTRNSDCTLMCMYCNVSVHKMCLWNIRKSFLMDNSHPMNGSWICMYCIDSLDDSKRIFEKERENATSMKSMIKSQIVIAKYWRRMRCRRAYLIIYKVILKIQIWFRLKKRKSTFLLKKLEKLRVMKINIESAEEILICTGKSSSNSPMAIKSVPNSYYAIVAVVDTLGNQKWLEISSTVTFPSVSKLTCHSSISFHSEHVLAGVSGSQLITVSVIQKGPRRDFFLGQVCLDLHLDHLWKKGGHLKCELAHLEHSIKDKNGQDIKFDYSYPPQGTLKVHLTVFNGMKAECGSVVGVPLEDFIRSINKLPSSSAFLFHRKSLSSSEKSNHKASSSSSSASTASSSFSGVASADEGPPKQEIKLPVQSSADASSIAMSLSKKKLWIAILEGFLYIYSQYGGPLKLILNIAQFDYSMQPYHNGTLFSLMKFGYPTFHFQPVEKADFVRWKCALICGFRYALDPQGGFDMDQLIDDIVKVIAANDQNQRHQQLLLQRQSSFVEPGGGILSVSTSEHSYHPGRSPQVRVRKGAQYATVSPKINRPKGGRLSPLAVSSFSSASCDSDEDTGLFRPSMKESKDSPSNANHKSKLLSTVLVSKVFSEADNLGIEKSDTSPKDLRTSLAEMNLLDDEATDESFLAQAELFAGLIFSRNIDHRLK